MWTIALTCHLLSMMYDLIFSPQIPSQHTRGSRGGKAVSSQTVTQEACLTHGYHGAAAVHTLVQEAPLMSRETQTSIQKSVSDVTEYSNYEKCDWVKKNKTKQNWNSYNLAEVCLCIGEKCLFCFKKDTLWSVQWQSLCWTHWLYNRERWNYHSWRMFFQ